MAHYSNVNVPRLHVACRFLRNGHAALSILGVNGHVVGVGVGVVVEAGEGGLL